ncbi:acyltransferase family protein [Arcanobacterium canis]
MTQIQGQPMQGDHPRIIGLDGLRAIAAGIVVLYHLLPHTVPVGFVGVDVFFVISGFLITSLLLREGQATGRIRFGRFWMRRFRRLFPAVIVAALGAAGIAALVGGDATTGLRWQLSGALTGTYNWFQVANSSSYFDASNPLLLTNLWSLAVELQFYFVWPIILILLVALVQKKAMRVAIAVALAACSVAWHAHLTTIDVTRAYVGTDSHSFGLMIGAAIALALPGVMVQRLPEASPHWGRAAFAALIALIAFGIFAPDGAWMYPWGMVIASVLSAVIVRGLLPDVRKGIGPYLAQLLESRSMVWLGQRSYGIYLWHWPLWVIFFYAVNLNVALEAVLIVIASVVLAHVSYSYVENPIRIQTFVGWIRGLRQSAMRATVYGVAATLLIGTSVYGAVMSSNLTSAQLLVQHGQEALERSQKAAESSRPKKNVPQSKSDQQSDGKSDPAGGQKDEQKKKTITGDRVTVIGDSVSLASAGALAQALPGIYIDAKVSRSLQASPAVATQLQSQGKLKEYVVIGLATNGNLPTRYVDKLFDAVGEGHKYVFVTGFAPPYATWVPQANQQIAQLAKKYPDTVRVADWASIAKANVELLAGDKIHPGPKAAALYAAEVKRALASF